MRPVNKPIKLLLNREVSVRVSGHTPLINGSPSPLNSTRPDHKSEHPTRETYD
ncbi:hypothetical protein YC2023_023099 [Brassica napus]